MSYCKILCYFCKRSNKVNELIADIDSHWPEVKNKWHIDSYRAVTKVGDYTIKIVEAIEDAKSIKSSVDSNDLKLFFINLGGYQMGSFEEFHHKLLIVASSQAEAIKKAKQSAFYKQSTFKDKESALNAASHIDDKFEVDIDDIYTVKDLINKVNILIEPITSKEVIEDKEYVGYLSIKNLKKLAL